MYDHVHRAYIIFLILVVGLLSDLNILKSPYKRFILQIVKVLDEIYKTSLTDGNSYEWLDFLSNQIGGRLSGSLNAQRAVDWAELER